MALIVVVLKLTQRGERYGRRDMTVGPS